MMASCARLGTRNCAHDKAPRLALTAPTEVDLTSISASITFCLRWTPVSTTPLIMGTAPTRCTRMVPEQLSHPLPLQLVADA